MRQERAPRNGRRKSGSAWNFLFLSSGLLHRTGKLTLDPISFEAKHRSDAVNRLAPEEKNAACPGNEHERKDHCPLRRREREVKLIGART